MSIETKFGYVNNAGAKIYYEACGAGTPLLLLHGNGEDMRYFDKQIPCLAPNYRVVTMDCRGHGGSSFGRETLGFGVMAQDVVTVLDALQIPAAHVLGFSDGGNIALTMALTHPGRLRSMILVGANLTPRGVKIGTQLPIIIGHRICSLCAPFSPVAREKSQILGLMVHEPQIPSEQLAAIRIPALIVAGEHDIIKLEHTKLIHRSIKGSKLVIVPKAGHFIADKMPDVFNKIILNFLDGMEAKHEYSI